MCILVGALTITSGLECVVGNLAYIYTYICMYLYIYIYIYICGISQGIIVQLESVHFKTRERERERERERAKRGFNSDHIGVICLTRSGWFLFFVCASSYRVQKRFYGSILAILFLILARGHCVLRRTDTARNPIGSQRGLPVREGENSFPKGGSH